MIQTVPELFPVYITLGGDTVRDSVYIPVPITQKEYRTEDYRLSISGYKPNLDYIEIYRKTEQIRCWHGNRGWHRKKWSVSLYWSWWFLSYLVAVMVYCYLDGCFLMRIRIKFITLQNLIHKIENKNERYSI